VHLPTSRRPPAHKERPSSAAAVRAYAVSRSDDAARREAARTAAAVSTPRRRLGRPATADGVRGTTPGETAVIRGSSHKEEEHAIRPVPLTQAQVLARYRRPMSARGRRPPSAGVDNNNINNNSNNSNNNNRNSNSNDNNSNNHNNNNNNKLENRELLTPPLPEKGVPGDPMRAPSIDFLAGEFLRDVEAAGFSTDSRVYEIEWRVIRSRGQCVRCPRDGRKGCAYVDTLWGEAAVGQATHMLSYTWGYRVCDIAAGLESYCSLRGISSEETYVWICCLCINQHRVKEAQMRGDVVPFDAFAAEFGDRVRNVGCVLALMAPWQAPVVLGRVWCVFELHMAEEIGKPVDVVMPPQEARDFAEAIFTPDGLKKLWGALSGVRVEHAEASVPADRENILQLVKQGVGAGKLNRAVVSKLQGWFTHAAESHVRQRLEEDRSEETAGACFQVAKMFHQLARFDQAEALMEEGRAVLDEIGQFRGLAKITFLRGMGMVQTQRGKLSEAWDSFSEARSLHGLEGDLFSTMEGADLLRHMGSVLRLRGDVAGALEMCREALAAYTSVQALETSEAATLFQDMGVACAQAGDRSAALSHFDQAVQVHAAIGSSETPDCAHLVQNIGVEQRQAGELEGARSSFLEARRLLGLTGTLETPQGANLLQNLGVVHKLLGDLKQAASSYEEAHGIFMSTGTLETGNGADLLENMGDLARQQGESELASARYEEAYLIRESTGTLDTANGRGLGAKLDRELGRSLDEAGGMPPDGCADELPPEPWAVAVEHVREEGAEVAQHYVMAPVSYTTSACVPDDVVVAEELWEAPVSFA
ncbi:unnamed protein product, partial [Polarella glacialis]